MRSVVSDRGEEFPSVSAAARKMGVSPCAMSYALKHGTKCGCRRWAFFAPYGEPGGRWVRDIWGRFNWEGGL